MKLDKEFIRLQKQIEKMSKHRETTVARNHKKVLDTLRRRLAKLYEMYEIDGQLTFDEMAKYNRLQKLDKEVEQMINELYKDNTKLIRGHLTGIAKETSLYTIEVVEGATQRKLKGIVKELDVSKTINDEMAGLKWTERMGKHRNDVIWDIQKEIKQGLTQGDTYGTMAKRLKKELEISATKSNVIVRTESHRVHAQAKADSLDSIAKHGVKMTKKWISSKDERVRSQHSEMDGVEIPYEDDFTMPDGATGKAPGLIGEPQHDINCRCIMTIGIVNDDKEGYNVSEESEENNNVDVNFEKAVNKALEHGEKTGNECLLWLDTKGREVVKVATGDKNSVTINQETVSYLLGAKKDTVISLHNHPGNSAFSPEDMNVACLFESIKEMRVIGHDETEYYLKIGDGERPSLHKIRSKYNEIRDELQNKYQKIYNETLDAKSTWKEHSNEINQKLAKEFNWRYRRVSK